MHALSHGFSQYLKMKLQALLSASAWLLSQVLPITLQKFSPCHQKGHRPFTFPPVEVLLCLELPGKLIKACKPVLCPPLPRWHQELLLLPAALLCFHFQVREISAHDSHKDFFICTKFLFLFLQSCPLPFFWICRFHLSTLSHIKVTDYYLSILISLLLQKP